LHLLKPRS